MNPREYIDVDPRTLHLPPSRAAKLVPGTLIRVEVVGDLPGSCGHLPTIGDQVS